MPKRAVVLGGGGSRGPYHIGVWQALNELGLDYHIVTGTSVGAINGAFFAQQKFDVAKSMWESLKTQDVIASLPDENANIEDRNLALINFFRQSAQNGGLDVTPLEKILRSSIDEDAVRASPIELGIVTTKIPDIKPVQLLRADIAHGKLVDYILASASCFPFFPQRDIGGVKYIDGGYTDNLPVNLAVSCGAEEIIAVDLQAIGVVHSYKNEQIPVTYIRSSWDLGMFLIFDADKAKRNMRLGYQDAMKAYRKLEGKAYAFNKGETRKNTGMLRLSFDKIRKQTGVDLFHNYQLIPKTFEKLSTADRFFLQSCNETYTLGHSVTTAAEITAELLKVPPDKIYDFDEFNRELHNRSAFLRETEFSINFDQSGSLYMIRIMYNYLKQAYETKILSDAFWGFATVAPKCFIAAYYLLALQVHNLK